MSKLISKNPAKNFQKIGEVDISTKEYIFKCVSKAQGAKALWKTIGIKDRIKILKPILDNFLANERELSFLITRETGKPIKEARGEVEKSLSYFNYYLNNAPKYLAEEITYKDDRNIDTLTYQPIGLAAVIIPWNYPFMLAIWGIIPNLLAGNLVIFKHSELSPLTGQFIEKIMLSRNLPQGVFSEIYGDGKQGQMLVNCNIDLIWFTGSSKIGQKLYAIAGEKMIRTVLEMGGSNPAIVLKDVDIKKTAKDIFDSRFKNCGQYCNATKRVIAHKLIFDDLVSELKRIAQSMVVGDPESENTDIGSMISLEQRNLLISQLDDAVAKGANIVCGGSAPANLRGAYYLPTIVTKVKRNMRIWKEEVFGPILPVVPFKSEQEAIELANDTVYGLGAQVFSGNCGKALNIADQIDCGMVDVNGGKSSKYCNPFGGNKNSGIGREHGKWGFQELCKIKVVSQGK